MTSTPEPSRSPSSSPERQTTPAREMVSAIAAADRLDREHRSHQGRNVWVQVARVGTLGWVLALPIVGGAVLGHFIDRRLGTGLTFTLALLLFGLATAGFALWRQTTELDD